MEYVNSVDLFKLLYLTSSCRNLPQLWLFFELPLSLKVSSTCGVRVHLGSRVWPLGGCAHWRSCLAGGREPLFYCAKPQRELPHLLSQRVVRTSLQSYPLLGLVVPIDAHPVSDGVGCGRE